MTTLSSLVSSYAATGPAGNISLGTTIPVSPVTSPSVTNTGNSQYASFVFSLPIASNVSLGTVSRVSPVTEPGVSSSVSSGNVALNFSLPIASNVRIGNVVTSAAGSSAVVTNVGTSGNVVLDFTIPKGDTGIISSVGGVSANTVTNAQILSAFTSAVSPGTAGNVLTSDGTNWISKVAEGGGITTGKAIAMAIVFG